MKRSKFTEAQIAFILRQAEEGTAVGEVCRKAGISEATYYNWRKKYAGLMPSEMKRLRLLEEENGKLKKIVADLSLDKAMLHRKGGPMQVQAAIAALHARAAKPEDTDWPQIAQLYATLEKMQPSPVIALNRAVAVSKADSPEAALDMIEPLRGETTPCRPCGEGALRRQPRTI